MEEESKRLNSLLAYKILDTVPEEFFDAITKMAAKICDTPIALISLVDDKRQWFKSRFGLDAPSTPKEISFCQHAIKGDEIYEVENALNTDLFKDNPLVTGDPNIRFYAGIPLKSAEGYNIGTLCVIDRKERKLTDDQKDLLKTFADSVISQLELKKQNDTLTQTQKINDEIAALSGIGSWRVDLLEQTVFWDSRTKKIHEVKGDFNPDLGTGINFYKEGYGRETISQCVEEAIETGKPWDVELIIVSALGKEKWIRAKGNVEFKAGKPIALYGTFQDISQQIKTVELLKKQRQNLKAVIDGARIGIWNWNPQTNEVDFSDSWKTMLGYTPGEISNNIEEWSSRLHPEDIDQCQADIEKHVSGDAEIYSNEHRMQHKDGHWIMGS